MKHRHAQSNPLAVLMAALVTLLLSIPLNLNAVWIDGWDGDFSYTLNFEEKTATLTKYFSYTPKDSIDVVIPDKISDMEGNEYKVTEIAYGVFEYNDKEKIRSVVLPKYLRKLSFDVFSACANLTSVTVRCPVSEEFILNWMFNNSNKLMTFDAGDDNEYFKSVDGVLYDKELKTLIASPSAKDVVLIPNTVDSIAGWAFSHSRIRNVTLSKAVTKIGIGAFSQSYIESVKIESDSLRIGNSVFYDCRKLEKVDCRARLNNIPYGSFQECKILKSVNWTDTVYEVGASAFYNCTSLVSIGSIGKLSYVGHNAFNNCNKLKARISFRDGVTIGEKAFYNCELMSMSYPDNAQVGKNAFQQSGLEGALFLTKSEIEDGAFNKCAKLESVTISSEVTVIGQAAFAGCSSMKSLKIGSIEEELNPRLTIRDYAFSDCKNLEYLTIGNNIKKIGSGSFYLGSNLKELYLGHSFETYNEYKLSYNTKYLEVLYSQVPISYLSGCSKLRSLTLPFPGMGTAEAFGNFGELFSTSSYEGARAVVQYFENGRQKTYYIPTSLEELTILEGCGMIPYGGLSNCNMLKKLTLPSSMYMVGDKALYGCAQLTDIYCLGAEPPVAFDSSFDGMRLTSCKLHVPYNSGDLYRNAEGWRRFTYIQEEAPIEVRVVKNIENGGVVFGIEEYRPGQTASLRAIANSGYTFGGWYEGETLLTDADVYEFSVIGSRELIAEFLPVVNDNPVVISPSGGQVSLLWPPVDGAVRYFAAVYEDAAMSREVQSAVVDSNGSRAADLSVTFSVLSPDTTYYYSIRATGVGNVTLSRYDGSFATTSAGVGEVVTSPEGRVVVGYYNAQGVMADRPWQGLNVAVYSDGSTRKLLIQ
ncbi:MAG: leucine-rich repeat protein [[Clostridium] fimetarium]|nr:leucine-rich repeat protein [Alistipes timonensis]MCM1406485.1 leucine-rich repeat protein [[Clostridium] fimetarium]